MVRDDLSQISNNVISSNDLQCLIKAYNALMIYNALQILEFFVTNILSCSECTVIVCTI